MKWPNSEVGKKVRERKRLRRKVIVVAYWLGLVVLTGWLFTTPASDYSFLLMVPGIVAAFVGLFLIEWSREIN